MDRFRHGHFPHQPRVPDPPQWHRPTSIYPYVNTLPARGTSPTTSSALRLGLLLVRLVRSGVANRGGYGTLFLLKCHVQNKRPKLGTLAPTQNVGENAILYPPNSRGHHGDQMAARALVGGQCRGDHDSFLYSGPSRSTARLFAAARSAEAAGQNEVAVRGACPDSTRLHPMRTRPVLRASAASSTARNKFI